MDLGDVRWIEYRPRWGEDMQSSPTIPLANARVKVCVHGPGCPPRLVTHSAGKVNMDNSGTGHGKMQVSWAGHHVHVAGSASRSSVRRSWGHTLRALKAMVSL